MYPYGFTWMYCKYLANIDSDNTPIIKSFNSVLHLKVMTTISTLEVDLILFPYGFLISFKNPAPLPENAK